MYNVIFGIPNVSFFDSYWVAVHFSGGLLTGLGILTYYHHRSKNISAKHYAYSGLSILIIWEYFEVFLRFVDQYGVHSREALRSFIPSSYFDIESTTNILSDLILGAIGLYLIYQYRKRKSKTINRRLKHDD